MSKEKKRAKMVNEKENRRKRLNANIGLALNEIKNTLYNAGATSFQVNEFVTNAKPAVISSVNAFMNNLARLPKTPINAAKSMLEVGDKQITKGIGQQSITTECQSGCNFCCQNMKISFCEDEAILIAEAVSKFSEDEKHSLLQRVENFGPTESGKGTGQCALLGDDGKCSIYDNRPMTCRAYHSTSSLKCEMKLNNQKENIVENTVSAFPSDYGVLYSYWTILQVREYQYIYEMNTFLERILKFQGRLDEWSKGVLIDEKEVALLSPYKSSRKQRKIIPLVLIQQEARMIENRNGCFIQRLANIFRWLK